MWHTFRRKSDEGQKSSIYLQTQQRQEPDGRNLFEHPRRGTVSGRKRRTRSKAVDPRVVNAMAEIGYDLSHQASKDVFSFFREGRLYDAVITVCDVDTEKDCPVFPGIVRRLSWPFADPALVTGDEEEKMERVRGIRDAIMTVVADFAVDETGACNGESG